MRVAISPLSCAFCREWVPVSGSIRTEAGFPAVKEAEGGISALGGGRKRKEVGLNRRFKSLLTLTRGLLFHSRCWLYRCIHKPHHIWNINNPSCKTPDTHTMPRTEQVHGRRKVEYNSGSWSENYPKFTFSEVQHLICSWEREVHSLPIFLLLNKMLHPEMDLQGVVGE